MAITLDGSVGITTPSLTDTGTLSVTGASTLTGGASLAGVNASPYTMKNRIINGAMVIDQRNAGASITPTTDTYLVDRWKCNVSASSKYSAQQNAGSVTPPAGFTNYFGVTSLSAYTVGAGETYGIFQSIEGYNTADLNWGTANAKTVTLSFWVYSSVAGTHAGSLRNGNADRSYPFTYTISTANTWQYQTVTVPGDTTGTWYTNSSGGTMLTFSL